MATKPQITNSYRILIENPEVFDENNIELKLSKQIIGYIGAVDPAAKIISTFQKTFLKCKNLKIKHRIELQLALEWFGHESIKTTRDLYPYFQS